jgi:WD40 repeat protein
LATSGTDDAIRIWNANTLRKLAELSNGSGVLRFSPDGRTLAINRGSHVELWNVRADPAGGSKALELRLHDVFLLPYAVMEPALVFSPDGKLLAASNGSLVVYEIDERRKASR